MGLLKVRCAQDSFVNNRRKRVRQGHERSRRGVSGTDADAIEAA